MSNLNRNQGGNASTGDRDFQEVHSASNCSVSERQSEDYLSFYIVPNASSVQAAVHAGNGSSTPSFSAGWMEVMWKKNRVREACSRLRLFA